MGEGDRPRQTVAVMGPVGETPQGGRELDLQPPLARVPTDGLVAPGFGLLPVGADEPSPGPPVLLALLGAEVGGLEVVARPGQAAASPTHGHPASGEALLDVGQARHERLETLLAVGMLRLAGIAPDPAVASHRQRQATADRLDPGLQALRLGPEVAACQLPGILGAARDRARPPGRRAGGHLAFALTPGLRCRLGIELAFGTPARQVRSGERAEMRAEAHEHRIVIGARAKAGSDPGAGRGRHHKRLGDRAQTAHDCSCANAIGPTSLAAERSAFSARLRADRRPYSRAQNEVRTSVMSRTRSSSTSAGSSTTRVRPIADNAASTNSTFIRPSRSLCSTTTVRTAGSASKRRTFARAPFIPDPTSASMRSTRAPSFAANSERRAPWRPETQRWPRGATRP